MNSDLATLANNGTWNLVNLPLNFKYIGNIEIYKIKYKDDDSIYKYKKILDEKGWSQIDGLDFLLVLTSGKFVYC